MDAILPVGTDILPACCRRGYGRTQPVPHVQPEVTWRSCVKAARMAMMIPNASSRVGRRPLDDVALEASSVVANNAMNRERGLEEDPSDTWSTDSARQRVSGQLQIAENMPLILWGCGIDSDT